MGKLEGLRREDGFTLIELLIVLVILGILLGIAVPAYLGFKDRAANRSAQADIRAAIPSAEAYYESNNHYTGMTHAGLKAIDAGLSGAVTVVSADTTTSGYCLSATIGGKSWAVKGPGATGWYQSTDCHSTSAVSP